MTSSAESSFVRCEPASEWVIRFGELVTPRGRVLDVACGGGRHANWFAARGHPVDAVDRQLPPELSAPIAFKQADIESGRWPYEGQQYSCVVVTNYLHRPLFPRLLSALAPGGWLIYETFAEGNEKLGKPSRPEFLLKPGELLEVVRDRLMVAAYEHGPVATPKPAIVQRIAARRYPGSDDGLGTGLGER